MGQKRLKRVITPTDEIKMPFELPEGLKHPPREIQQGPAIYTKDFRAEMQSGLDNLLVAGHLLGVKNATEKPIQTTTTPEPVSIEEERRLTGTITTTTTPEPVYSDPDVPKRGYTSKAFAELWKLTEGHHACCSCAACAALSGWDAADEAKALKEESAGAGEPIATVVDLVSFAIIDPPVTCDWRTNNCDCCGGPGVVMKYGRNGKEYFFCRPQCLDRKMKEVRSSEDRQD